MTAAARGGLSLRSRVLIGLGTIAAVAVAIAIVVTGFTHTFLVSQLDDRLASSSVSLGDGDRPRLVTECGSGDGAQPSDNDRPSDVFRGAVDFEGNCYVLFTPNTMGAGDASPVFDGATLPTSGSTYFTVPSSDGTGEYRVLAKATSWGADITALSTDGVEAATHRLILIETFGILAVLAGLAVVGWWVINLGVNPMRRMVDASARIADGDLDVRLEGAGHGSESAELATSLNTMIATLTTALEENERSSARLREFVADASHELRTPLTTVLGYAELYRRGALPNDAAVADAWTRTEAEAARMSRLVQDMLELAKYDAEPQLTVISLDLATLGAEVVADAQAAREGVTFTLDAPSAVPTAGDADRLRQAVINLVGNAAVHGGSEITVRACTVDGRALISVIDDGPGMSPEMAARATERFVRGDGSRARSTGGAGLGLAITSAIVEAHGGVLTVESEEGEGTTVTISLPAVPSA